MLLPPGSLVISRAVAEALVDQMHAGDISAAPVCRLQNFTLTCKHVINANLRCLRASNAASVWCCIAFPPLHRLSSPTRLQGSQDAEQDPTKYEHTFVAVTADGGMPSGAC